MKKRLYHSLFRVFSYLSDKTNGAPFVVKYKLIIGTLIIGLASSCNGGKEKTIEKKEIDRKPIDTMLVTCYDAVISDDSISFSERVPPAEPVKKKRVQIKKFEPQDMSDSIITVVTCYMPSMDALKRVDENIEKIKDSME